MPRTPLTDEERAARRDARLERARAKRAKKAAEREQLKTVIRGEIAVLASVIPPPAFGMAAFTWCAHGKTRSTPRLAPPNCMLHRSSGWNLRATR